MAMGLACRADAWRTRAIVRACSAGVPWEKLRRATSMPARIRRSTIWAESLAGPSVQMIFERRKFMPCPGSARLFGPRELLHDAVEVLDPLAEGLERDALVVGVHPAVVLIREREGQ